MRLKNVYGKMVFKNVSKYIIDWDGPCKSQLQFKVKQFLKPFWNGLIVYEEFPVYGTLLKVDFYNATLNIAVEVNGPQHDEFHFFHDNSPNAYLQSIKRDMQKAEWLAANEIKLIEINHDEVDTLTAKFFKEKFDVTL